MAAAVPTSISTSGGTDIDKLTYEIFSILENNFLFGCDNPKFPLPNKPKISTIASTGKVRILSIDGDGATGGVLAAKSLVHLDRLLRRKSGNPKDSISDYFDLVAGSGVGGFLAALLFTRSKDGDLNPMFTAEDTLKLLLRRRSSSTGVMRRLGMGEKNLAAKVFGDNYTLKDMVKPILVPCYDLESNSTFVFSRADAIETDRYDFTMTDVCTAASARKPMEVKSMDGRVKITAVDGRVAMNNPTAAAITHVLNNKQEFPSCNGVEDILVLSLGNGGSDFVSSKPESTRSAFTRVAQDGASEMVDQAVSMAFSQSAESNYTRIQPLAAMSKEQNNLKKLMDTLEVSAYIDVLLNQKYVKSVPFRGKTITEKTNMERIECFVGDMIKEQERRKTSINLHPVVMKQPASLPSSGRTSSATTMSISSSSTT